MPTLTPGPDTAIIQLRQTVICTCGHADHRAPTPRRRSRHRHRDARIRLAVAQLAISAVAPRPRLANSVHAHIDAPHRGGDAMVRRVCRGEHRRQHLAVARIEHRPRRGIIGERARPVRRGVQLRLGQRRAQRDVRRRRPGDHRCGLRHRERPFHIRRGVIRIPRLRSAEGRRAGGHERHRVPAHRRHARRQARERDRQARTGRGVDRERCVAEDVVRDRVEGNRLRSANRQRAAGGRARPGGVGDPQVNRMRAVPQAQRRERGRGQGRRRAVGVAESSVVIEVPREREAVAGVWVRAAAVERERAALVDRVRPAGIGHGRAVDALEFNPVEIEPGPDILEVHDLHACGQAERLAAHLHERAPVARARHRDRPGRWSA